MGMCILGHYMSTEGVSDEQIVQCQQQSSPASVALNTQAQLVQPLTSAATANCLDGMLWSFAGASKTTPNLVPRPYDQTFPSMENTTLAEYITTSDYSMPSIVTNTIAPFPTCPAVIFREDFESPNEDKTYSVCQNCRPELQGWMNPSHPNYVKVEHSETGGHHMTVFGFRRCPGQQSCGAETLNSPGLTLEANTRYVLTFDVSPGLSNRWGDYEVQLCVLLDEKPSVWQRGRRWPRNKKKTLASTRGLVSKRDFSESGRVEYFSPGVGNEIGKQVVMRFLDTDYSHYKNRPSFDNVRLTVEQAESVPAAVFLGTAGTTSFDYALSEVDSWMLPGLDTSVVQIKTQGSGQYLSVNRSSSCGEYMKCGAETVGSRELVLESGATYILSYEVGAAQGVIGDYEVQLAVMTSRRQFARDPRRNLWPLATRGGVVEGMGGTSERHELVYTARNAETFVNKMIVIGLFDDNIGEASNSPIFSGIRLTRYKPTEEADNDEISEDEVNGK